MASLTLKNIPPGLHDQLRARAVRNRRSLSQEALACLELAVAGEPIDARAVLAAARRLRARVKRVSQREIDAWVELGRP